VIVLEGAAAVGQTAVSGSAVINGEPERSAVPSNTVPAVSNDAHALSLFRALQNGEPRAYSATTFPRDPYQGCERMVRMARAFGYLVAPHADCYGVLDVLNADGDIVQDYAVTSAAAFAWLKKKLRIVVESIEDEQ